MGDSITSWIKHLENPSSLNYADLPNIAYLIKISKITHINIATNLIRKTHDVKLTVVLIKFSKIPICTCNFKFYSWQHILSVVFLEVAISLCSFWRNCQPNIQVWITVVCLSVVFQTEILLCEREQLVELLTQTVAHKHFPQDNHCTSKFSKNFSCVLCILSHRILRVSLW